MSTHVIMERQSRLLEDIRMQPKVNDWGSKMGTFSDIIERNIFKWELLEDVECKLTLGL